MVKKDTHRSYVYLYHFHVHHFYKEVTTSPELTKVWTSYLDLILGLIRFSCSWQQARRFAMYTMFVLQTAVCKKFSSFKETKNDYFTKFVKLI